MSGPLNYVDAENWSAWAVGKWVDERFHVRRIVWGRLVAHDEKRPDEVIVKAMIMVESRG